ncbi:GIY-YIG nuclease family protein [Algoriphagus sp.]|uniref:GIY-YIG nuclease family protein n=2 Tax=Algoriphagus sp. TaxID=1872435 RepID=UPI003298FC79
MDFSVYILHSQSIDKFYIGYTSDFSQRLKFHNSDQNKIWTKKGQPWAVHILLEGLEKSQAMKIEKHLKNMKSRKYLIDLKLNPLNILDLKQRFS